MTISEERLRELELFHSPRLEEMKELVRGYREAQLLKQQSGSYQRLPGCQCTWEEGDSPCPVHGEHEEAPPAETKVCPECKGTGQADMIPPRDYCGTCKGTGSVPSGAKEGK